MVVDERVRVGSLAGPLRSLESAGKRKVKKGKHRKRQYKVRAQRQPSILTKGRAMPRVVRSARAQAGYHRRSPSVTRSHWPAFGKWPSPQRRLKL